MRPTLALVPLLLGLAACGGGGSDRRTEDRSDSSGSVQNAAEVSTDSAVGETAEQRAATGPNIALTAAPGVAFNYRYAFRLAAERLAEVQERHAARCESLGVNRCRIVGWVYRRHDDENIEARIDFKLDPSIARAFGREGVGTVVGANGMLVESEITGTDVGVRIRSAGRDIAQMREELARVEARLRGRLGGGDRSSLEYEAQQLRASIRAAEQNRAEAQESLATTPMTFVYGSGRHVPGPQPRQPVAETLEDAWENFLDGASILFVILVTLLPWILLAWLLWLAVGWARRRFVRTAPPPAPAEPAVES